MLFYVLIAFPNIRAISSVSILGFLTGIFIFSILFPSRIVSLVIAFPEGIETEFKPSSGGHVVLQDNRQLGNENRIEVTKGDEKKDNKKDNEPKTSGSESARSTIDDLKKKINRFLLKAAYPDFLSKGKPFKFLLFIFLKKHEAEVDIKIDKLFPINKHIETATNVEFPVKCKLIIKLFSHNIDFSEQKVISLPKEINEFQFIGQPKDTCKIGKDTILLTISDQTTNEELLSAAFEANIVDYAFDHVSRPVFGYASSIILGLTSLIITVLTTLEQIDKTTGFASGATLLVLTATVLGRNHWVYQKIKGHQTS